MAHCHRSHRCSRTQTRQSHTSLPRFVWRSAAARAGLAAIRQAKMDPASFAELEQACLNLYEGRSVSVLFSLLRSCVTGCCMALAQNVVSRLTPCVSVWLLRAGMRQRCSRPKTTSFNLRRNPMLLQSMCPTLGLLPMYFSCLSSCSEYQRQWRSCHLVTSAACVGVSAVRIPWHPWRVHFVHTRDRCAVV